MRKPFFLPTLALFFSVLSSSGTRAGTGPSSLDVFPREPRSAASANDSRCPASHPLYCAIVDRCCPSGMGYYCTNWQSLPAPSPLSEPLKGPCLNIKTFSEGQQYYLELNCDPHGCG